MNEGVQIVYDGECPFCSRYAMMSRMRDNIGRVELIDARSDHPLVEEIKSSGVDLIDGMLARYGGKDYFGPDCMTLLSVLSSGDTFTNKLLSRVFANEKLAGFLYPFLRLGRNMTLKVLGRSKIV